MCFFTGKLEKYFSLTSAQVFSLTSDTKIYIKFCGFRMIDQLFLKIFRSITITVLQLEFGL